MLFKYLPYKRVDVLENLKIRFSPLQSLNDPFECMFPIDVTKEIESAFNNVKKEFDEWWDSLEDNSAKNMNKYYNYIKAIRHGVENELNSHNVSENLLNTLDESFGILSLSRSYENLLLWAHYASDNAGYVLGFDETRMFSQQTDLCGNIVTPFNVLYSDTIQYFEYGTDNWREKLLCQKPIEWAYEQEERFFLSGMDLAKYTNKDIFGFRIVLYDFAPESVEKVFIGCKATQDTKNKIFDAIKKNKLNCSVYEAKPSKFEYKLEFKEINA
jgi:hypothetical protein